MTASTVTPLHCLETQSLGNAEVRVRPKTKEVELTVIKAGFGNKAGGRYYSPQLLEKHAKMFEGSKMYVDHITPRQERELAGMPRSLRDLVGKLHSTWYDPVSESVKGRAKINRDWFWELVENDPTVVGVSIDAIGTGRNGVVKGRQSKIVESFTRARSVDFVTEAGAGGGIDSILEAQQEVDLMALETITLDDLKTHRPDLITSIQESASGTSTEGAGDDKNKNGNGGDTLNADSFKEAVSSAVKDAVAEINAAADKRVTIVENNSTLDSLLSKSGLPEKARGEIRSRFTGVLCEAKAAEGESPAKSATEVYTEAVTAAIDTYKETIREATGGARVRGMGSSAAGGNAGEQGGNTVSIRESAPMHATLMDRLGVKLDDEGDKSKKGGENNGN